MPFCPSRHDQIVHCDGAVRTRIVESDRQIVITVTAAQSHSMRVKITVQGLLFIGSAP
jgi:hypothetical protein